MISTLIPIAAELTGRIEGGWGYVYACYGITWGSFALYTLSLMVRSRNLEIS